MGLLHLLAQGGLYPSERLIVAHLNHGLRPEAGIEEVYVAETAAAWGLDYRSSRADIAEISSERKMSIEEAARWVRYRFLAEVAQSNEAAAVATGHNADDQAETVLMHFLRGSGLAGLRGMRPVGPLPGASKETLVRPLLAVRAKQIRDYCRENGLNPVEDDSNEDMTIHRNRLRHELLPLLAGYNPNIIESLHNTAEVVAADYDLLMKLQEDAWSSILLTAGEGWLQLDRSGWRRLPLGLRRSALRQACEILKPLLRDVGFRPVEQARLVAESGQVGARSSLPKLPRFSPNRIRSCPSPAGWILAAAGRWRPRFGSRCRFKRPLAFAAAGRRCSIQAISPKSWSGGEPPVNASSRWA
jgi:tRNA(Ile)-lysidine synthase